MKREVISIPTQYKNYFAVRANSQRRMPDRQKQKISKHHDIRTSVLRQVSEYLQKMAEGQSTYDVRGTRAFTERKLVLETDSQRIGIHERRRCGMHG